MTSKNTTTVVSLVKPTCSVELHSIDIVRNKLLSILKGDLSFSETIEISHLICNLEKAAMDIRHLENHIKSQNSGNDSPSE